MLRFTARPPHWKKQMGFDVRRLLLTTSLLACLAIWVVATSSVAQVPASAPKIWDDQALADWATPIAALKVRPGHYTPAADCAIPAENLRTYPVYLPDHEPPGYWESLQKKKPDPLVDVSKIRTTSDWVEAGARAFRELDNPFSRTDNPALIAANSRSQDLCRNRRSRGRHRARPALGSDRARRHAHAVGVRGLSRQNGGGQDRRVRRAAL